MGKVYFLPRQTRQSSAKITVESRCECDNGGIIYVKQMEVVVDIDLQDKRTYYILDMGFKDIGMIRWVKN